MGLKSILSKPLAKYTVKQQNKWAKQPVKAQDDVFKSLISGAEHTAFGKDHNFNEIKNYEDFKKHVPIRDYEDLRPYIDRIIAGESDVLWKGKPTYLAKTSGTTSGMKYIPITKDSIPNHINSAKNAMLNYIAETGNAEFLDHKMIFLSGSPVLDKVGGILTGRLSGISNHMVPSYLKKNQVPTYETNCIEDWEDKLDNIVRETFDESMSFISGIPPWVQMYFDQLEEKSGKKIADLFPNFSLFMYGGVNFAPYREKLFDSIGKKVDSIETYPASEGFIAFQDSQKEDGLLIQLNSGIFFEFVPVEEYGSDNPTRLSIKDVELGKNYALILNSNAGLWGYSIGDTVKFVSKDPYRLVVSGRIKHYISAFGEHVIGEEVEKAMNHALSVCPEVKITEFSVAPQVNPTEGLPYHEWLVSFEQLPNDLDKFGKAIDEKLSELNGYYKDLIVGSITRNAVITPLQKDAFQQYMKSIGKLGGQNKVPRLANNRDIADKILEWKLEETK
ncbi:GH3 auxin-responsive promoter family protein [Sediminitomix flava]|uniref:Phenylacetate-coenzyme A ligase PaaK-like adenylate-forming protein n=1 Tax=Sediminitomix flava TaxID=379075 RepID=A0A315ZDX5_SEDFL|nr:GH3 auxin-responsive promoter family protein [Sediminitomix flava]PWJ43741.1 phenylacetate-coenzyme A ligase PaaK-like adenylate-forming protein [Sediminitomix flava]